MFVCRVPIGWSSLMEKLQTKPFSLKIVNIKLHKNMFIFSGGTIKNPNLNQSEISVYSTNLTSLLGWPNYCNAIKVRLAEWSKATSSSLVSLKRSGVRIPHLTKCIFLPCCIFRDDRTIWQRRQFGIPNNLARSVKWSI